MKKIASLIVIWSVFGAQAQTHGDTEGAGQQKLRDYKEQTITNFVCTEASCSKPHIRVRSNSMVYDRNRLFWVRQNFEVSYCQNKSNCSQGIKTCTQALRRMGNDFNYWSPNSGQNYTERMSQEFIAHQFAGMGTLCALAGLPVLGIPIAVGGYWIGSLARRNYEGSSSELKSLTSKAVQLKSTLVMEAMPRKYHFNGYNEKLTMSDLYNEMLSSISHYNSFCSAK